MRFNAARQQFIAQSVQPDGISGLSGKIMSPLFQLTIHGIRRTFQCNTDSRQVERVQWPHHPDPPSGHDSVAFWRGALFVSWGAF